MRFTFSPVKNIKYISGNANLISSKANECYYNIRQYINSLLSKAYCCGGPTLGPRARRVAILIFDGMRNLASKLESGDGPALQQKE